MKVERVELYHVSIPLKHIFRPAWIPGYPQLHNRFTLVRVITDEGIEGFSAGASMGREREGLGNLLGPYIIGIDPTNIDLIQQRLREMSYLGWRNYWIEPAFWDILGKEKGKSLWELLGGRGGEVKVYASFGEVMGPEEAAEKAFSAFEEGFEGIKLRVHDFDEDIDKGQVKGVSQALKGEIRIGVDANQGWRVTVIKDAPLWDLERAKRFSDFCYEMGVEWIEEPLPMDDYDAQSQLKRYSKVKIAGGELNSGGYPEFKIMMEKDCYHIYQPDATFCGGISQCFKIMKECEERGNFFTPHTWTNGIGFAINLHLFAASKSRNSLLLEYPYHPPSWTPDVRDAILESPFIHKNGKVKIPEKPGIGIEINWKTLKKYGKRFFKMTKRSLIFYSLRERGLKETIELGRIMKR
jgi:L-alanine-DL-glutamate epimerase-like enolase superfamily enzyme